MRESQIRESVIRPTSSLEIVKNKNAIQPIPEESLIEDENVAKETKKTVGAKGASYGVTLTHRTEEKNRYKLSAVWWPSPRCTMWWNNYLKEKNESYSNKEQNSCEGPKDREETAIASHNLGADFINRKHNWLKAVLNIENKQTQKKK